MHMLYNSDSFVVVQFDVPADGGDRRVQLANAALVRGAVTTADLRGPR